MNTKNTIHVLLVEDNPTDVLLVKDGLEEQQGFDLAVALRELTGGGLGAQPQSVRWSAAGRPNEAAGEAAGEFLSLPLRILDR